MRFTIDEILEGTGAALSQRTGSPASMPLRIVTDSREAGPATVFWALRGETHDGHDFVDAAITAGCDACVVDQNQHPSFLPPQGERVTEGRMSGSRATLIPVENTLTALQSLAAWNRTRSATPIVGITGSFGKTTTREMVHAALQYEVNTHRSPRNFNNHFGVPFTLLGLTATHEAAIVELGASAHGEIANLANMAQPRVGIITGIGQAHRATFGGPAEVARAKGELAEALPSEGLLLLSGDDSFSREIAARTSCRVVRVGTGPNNDLRVDSIIQQGEWLSVTVNAFEFRVRAAGRHFARSVLFAVATAQEFGLSNSQIAAGLADFHSPAGRCHVEKIGPWTVIDDSYNSSPEAFEAACGVLGNWQTNGRRILICGDMLELGEVASSCHRDAGVVAAQAGVDHILALGNFAPDLIETAIDAGLESNSCEAFKEMPELLHRLQQILRPDDVLLVKGSRGMRMERVIEWLRQESFTRSSEEGTSHPTQNRQFENMRN